MNSYLRINVRLQLVYINLTCLELVYSFHKLPNSRIIVIILIFRILRLTTLAFNHIILVFKTIQGLLFRPFSSSSFRRNSLWIFRLSLKLLLLMLLSIYFYINLWSISFIILPLKRDLGTSLSLTFFRIFFGSPS